MTLPDLDIVVAETLGPNWRWLVRSTAPHEGKPGRYLANITYDPGDRYPVYFPVFAETAAGAFAESLRRAELWQKEGVR